MISPQVEQDASGFAAPVGSAESNVSTNQEILLYTSELNRIHNVVVRPPLIANAIHLSGVLDHEKLQEALRLLVGRHAALRARFFPRTAIAPAGRRYALDLFARTGSIITPGLYHQSISGDVSVKVSNIVCEGCKDDADRRMQVKAVLQHEVMRGFEYEKPPLLRATIIRFEPYEHLLLLLVDHIAADAISMLILRQDLRNAYYALCGVQDFQLESSTRPYTEFAYWQQHTMQSTNEFCGALRHWEQRWRDYGSSRIALPELPFSRPPAKESILEHGECVRMLPEATSSALRILARQSRVTMYVLLAASCITLLQRYTRKRSIALWTHYANRYPAEFSQSVGWFANTHLLGIDLSDDPSFGELLKRVRQTVLEDLANQHLPLAWLWQKARFYPRHADARVSFSLIRSDEAGFSPPSQSPTPLSMRRSLLPAASWGRQPSLDLYGVLGVTSVSLAALYSCATFTTSAIEALLSDFDALLHEILARPTIRLSDVASCTRYELEPAQACPEMREFVVIGSDLIPSVQFPNVF